MKENVEGGTHPPRTLRFADGIALGTIFLLLVGVGGPLVAQTTEQQAKAMQTACLSNIKQIATGAITYSQDYDEVLPFAQGGIKIGAKWFPMNWGPRTTVGNQQVDSLLYPYIKNDAVFHCPAVTTSKSPITYMLNDIVAMRSTNEVVDPEVTVLACDSEDVMPNVGHAYMPDHEPAPATIKLVIPPNEYDASLPVKGLVLVPPGYGGRLRTAPTRHTGGANYAFTDGHCKWFTPERIFFPPRGDNSFLVKEKTREPIPGENMRGFAGTFRLR